MFNILSMLRKNSAESDPLDSEKTVTRWINDLPAGNVLNAHEQVLYKLAEFNAQGAPFNKERLAVVMRLDEYARALQTSLSQQYLRNPRMSRIMESRLWNAVYKFYWEVARAYHSFIMSYVADPAASPLRESIPQLTSRTLYNLGGVFKWHYLRYEKPADKLWLRLHNLYRVAEFEGFSKIALAPYASSSKSSCCADQYHRILLLGQLDTSVLYPKQIEMADRWLSEWSHLIEQESKFNPDTHALYVALSDDVGARRIRNTEFTESCRFIDVTKIHQKIQQSRTALLDGKSPAQLGLGEDCRLPDCFEILDYAERQWGPLENREQRKSQRTTVKKIIDVVHGFNEICTVVKQGHNGADVLHETDAGFKYDEMIDMKLYGFVTESTRTRNRHATPVATEKTPPHERWVMENMSDQGLGASVPTKSNDWGRLGSMVALKVERDAGWKIGVMRRLSHTDDGLLQIGIEVLSLKPQMMLLRPLSSRALPGYTVDGVETTDTTLPVPIIFISQSGNSQGELLLEAAQYASGRSFELNAGTQKKTIRLQEVIENGDGWIRVAVVIATDDTVN